MKTQVFYEVKAIVSEWIANNKNRFEEYGIDVDIITDTNDGLFVIFTLSCKLRPQRSVVPFLR
jgi:hypothetical protein